MARPKNHFVCQACGAAHSRWLGRCDACGAWNSIVEEAPAIVPGLGKTAARTPARGPSSAGGAAAARGPGPQRVEFVSLETRESEPERLLTGISEFDRVTGGGPVPGSAVLISGDPGVGKSTLLLQVAAAAAAQGHATVYISGEEAAEQLRLRARRLGLAKAPLSLAATTSLSPVIRALDGAQAPALLIVDSIQTMHLDELESAPGSVSQVRGSAQALVALAKKRGIAVLVVGHVTKDGLISGPKVLEHLVDAVLSFEGEQGGNFRILRAQKNRFGATDEIGVWEMTGDGLSEATNPSALFLGRRDAPAPGTAVFAGLEGSRPLLVEIQALAAPAPFGAPRRAVVGWDGRRLAQVLAVLEARCGLLFSQQEIYLNVAGGLTIREPAADLAVAAALISAARNSPLPQDAVFFGELALSGELRPAANTGVRLREAERLGFQEAWMPAPTAQGQGRAPEASVSTLRLCPLAHIGALVESVPAGESGGLQSPAQQAPSEREGAA